MQTGKHYDEIADGLLEADRILVVNFCHTSHILFPLYIVASPSTFPLPQTIYKQVQHGS